MSKADTIPAIRPRMGAGFLMRFFGGKPFLHCMLELIKNARDWGAGTVMLTTTLSRDLLRIVDFGNGMNQANRDAFLSINLTTARGPRQSGIFCTGTKQMLFSHATRVEVRTAPQEEPDWVYLFAFSTNEYEKMVLDQSTFMPTRLTKDAISWPYPALFGTEITYTLRNPRSMAILRGGKLGEALSVRLPLKFRDIVRVDDVPLPLKKIVGQLFAAVETHPQLGKVVFELYRPESRTSDDGLWLTAVEVGEVPMQQFFSSLRGLPVRFPPVLLLEDVCGTVSVQYIKEYMTESRTSVRPDVSDDTRTQLLLRIFQKFAPEIERRLKIAVKGAGEGSGDEEIRSVANTCNARYNPGGVRPPGIDRGGVGDDVGDGILIGDDNSDGDGGNDGNENPLRLSWLREVEVGETIEIRVFLAKGSGYTLDEIQWHTDRSRAKGFRNKGESVFMEACEVGAGVTRADLRGSPFSAVAYYTVVPQRLFRLSIPYAEIETGSQLIIMAVNSDKAKGTIVWTMDKDGAGEIQPQGARVIFHARREGRTVITASDSACNKTWATCEINVIPARGRLLCVRGHYFEWDVYETEGAAQFAKPATIIRGAKVHRLVYNRRAPAFAEAARGQWLNQYLCSAVAQEYARFERLELAEDAMANVDPRDVPGIITDIQNAGYVVLEEIVGSKKK